MTVVGPYSEIFIPGRPGQVQLFPDGFVFLKLGNGFETTIPLRWRGTLELSARIPGCPPITAECDDRGCDTF